jgi:Tfp pilus assembly protein PilP
MAPERAAAYLGGAILLAAWLASAAGVTHQPGASRVPAPTPDAVRFDALASEVQSQTARLRQRLAVAPAPQAPLRNPFVFATRQVQVRAQAPRRPEAPEAAGPAAPALPELDLVLVGMTEQGDIRTAMIAAGDELFVVTVGQAVGGRYEVSAVGPDGVELKDLSTGATRRLPMKLPA